MNEKTKNIGLASLIIVAVVAITGLLVKSLLSNAQKHTTQETSLSHNINSGTVGQTNTNINNDTTQATPGQSDNLDSTNSKTNNSQNTSVSSTPITQASPSSSSQSTIAEKPVTVPTMPGFNSVLLKTSSDSSLSAIKLHQQTMIAATAKIDLFNNMASVQKEFQALDSTTIQTMLDQTREAKHKILQTPVPEKTLGLAQGYYATYAAYENLLTKTLDLFKPEVLTDSQRTAILNQLNIYTEDFVNTIGRANVAIDSTNALIAQMQK